MAGHSKFKKIVHKKTAQDALRSKKFSKLSQEISSAAALDPNPETNIALRNAIKAASGANMPKQNVEKAIASASNVSDQELLVAAYGPHNVAFLVEIITDNKTKSMIDAKKIMSKMSMNVVSAVNVLFMFEKIGVLTFASSACSNAEMFDKVVESGADDFEEIKEEDVLQYNVYCDYSKLHDILKHFADQHNLHAEKIGLHWKVKDNYAIEIPEEGIESIQPLVDAIYDIPEVVNVVSNNYQ